MFESSFYSPILTAPIRRRKKRRNKDIKKKVRQGQDILKHTHTYIVNDRHQTQHMLTKTSNIRRRQWKNINKWVWTDEIE